MKMSDVGEHADQVQRAYEERFAKPLFSFEEIIPGSGLHLQDAEGRETRPGVWGWDHFKKGPGHEHKRLSTNLP